MECELDFHTQTGAGTGCSQHTERAAQAAVKLLKLYLLSHSQLYASTICHMHEYINVLSAYIKVVGIFKPLQHSRYFNLASTADAIKFCSSLCPYEQLELKDNGN